MLKTLIIPDSFKGSLTSSEVGRIIADNLDKSKYSPYTMTISDGGEGFLEAIAQGKQWDSAPSTDALGRQNTSRYLVHGDTLCFELAESVGIKDLKKDELDVFSASTYGLGLAVKHGIEKHHPKRIIFGIGGSASNDGGTGLLQALGVKFYDKHRQLLHTMCNKALTDIEYIDTNNFDKLTAGISVKVLSDVTNPLLGPNGATHVYAAQKGGNPQDLPILESNMKHYSHICTQLFNKDTTLTPGAGAAGGVGYGLCSFWNAELASGIEYVLSENGFADSVQDYDLVITGEGRVDSQSLQGKVLSGIIAHNPKKLCLVVGSSLLESCQFPVYAIVPEIASAEQSMAEPEKWLAELVKAKFN